MVRNPISMWVCITTVLVTTVTIWKDPAIEQAASTPPHKSSNSASLGGPDRYLSYISTDKPIYREGETVFVRAVVLHQATRQPLPSNRPLNAHFQIIGPKGDEVAGGYQSALDSVVSFGWKVPENQAGGEYTIKVSYPEGYPKAERKFDIRAYRAPRLKSQIKFLRDGYGPNDEVVAMLNVERAEGGFPVGAEVTVTGRVDGQEVARSQIRIDSNGKATARFVLPREIRRGEGTLAMTIQDGGAVETASKSIPILLQAIDLTVYPEGGELIAGLPNRVYLEAFTPAKKPADIAGRLIDSNGVEVALFKTEHEGRGRFEFTPKSNMTYELHIGQPGGIKSTHKLRAVLSQGVVIRTTKNRYQPSEPVSLMVGGADTQPVTVTLSKKETEVSRVELDQLAATKMYPVQLTPPASADGILIATVWGADGRPLAERLLFREPSSSVSVEMIPSAKQYTPGSKAGVKVITKDQNGKPVSAIVGVTVTDESVLEMVDKREQRPHLPVQVFLESDVKELADAHIYFDPKNDKSALAVDLLLGTQGWRRFAFVAPNDFIKEHGELASRVLALRTPPPPPATNRFRNLQVEERAERLFAVAEAAPSAPVDAIADKKLDAELENAKVKVDVEDRIHPQKSEVALKEIGGLGQADEFHGGMARNDFLAVRIYAHEVRKDRQPNDRLDFTETIFWSAGIKTNENGEAEVGFGLCDSVTAFRVSAEAFSATGALGSASTSFNSVVPFYIESKPPIEVTAGDIVELPITAINATDGELKNLRLTANWSQSNTKLGQISQSLKSNARIRNLAQVNVGTAIGPAEIVVAAEVDGFSDKVSRRVVVRPKGFPVEYGRGGLIGPGELASHEVVIPNDWVDGSLETQVSVYPSPLSSMTSALERLIQEPNGCFEQTSSTTYPLIMAQQYFMSHQGVDPELIERASRTLETSYQRLIGFECKSGGFEWFGQDPGHDALTAYGLMEFSDMAKVRAVDKELLLRTKTWLLAQRDGKGTFARRTHTLHTWLPDPEIATSYNLWALLESKTDANLSTEVNWVRDVGSKSQNSYVTALAANVLSLAGDRDGENQMLDKLAGNQSTLGNLKGATVSVIGSTGEALEIETTALATLAWLRNPSYVQEVERAIQFLSEQCKAGRFGSTQSTILALKAIVAYDASRATPKAAGQLQLIVDDQPVGQPLAFTTEDKGTLKLPAFQLHPGKHTVAIRMANGSKMPYSIAVKYHRLRPDSDEGCKLHLEAKLRDTKLVEGDVTEVAVSLTNRKGETVPTPIAIVGIPGGFEVRHDQLKELVKSNKIAAYEVRGREVILYWRALAAEARVDFPISLVAAIPGTYTAPASRAYLYYTDEFKHWVDGVSATIRPISR
jgi:alpha-2-macroglobulin-like protein